MNCLWTNIIYSVVVLALTMATYAVNQTKMPLQLISHIEIDHRVVVVPICFLAIFLVGRHYMQRYEMAKADQWQLLIRNGTLIDAKVGGTHFRGMFDTIVRFPSSIMKVKFRVEQVSREMQGVVVSGFALWSVQRTDDGPFRAYKNLHMRDEDEDGGVDNQSGNSYVADCAASIIRVTVANLTLQDVLTKRDEIRTTVREVMQQQVNGWGVWLETVEISDVQVSSKRLFEDLQCEFRNEQRLRAERIRLSTERTLKEEQLAHDVEESRRTAEAETKKAVAKANAALEREQKQAELLEETEKVRIKTIEAKEKTEKVKIASERRIAESKANHDAAVQMAKVEGTLACERKEDERISQISDKGMQLLAMEHTTQIYKNTPVTVHSFLGREGGGPASLLPGAESLINQAAGWEVLAATANTATAK